MIGGAYSQMVDLDLLLGWHDRSTDQEQRQAAANVSKA